MKTLFLLLAISATSVGQTTNVVWTMDTLKSIFEVSNSEKIFLSTLGPVFTIDSAKYSVLYVDESDSVKWTIVTRYEVGFHPRYIVIARDWGTVFYVKPDGTEFKSKRILIQTREP